MQFSDHRRPYVDPVTGFRILPPGARYESGHRGSWSTRSRSLAWKRAKENNQRIRDEAELRWQALAKAINELKETNVLLSEALSHVLDD